jgi:hypothetical protein
MDKLTNIPNINPIDLVPKDEDLIIEEDIDINDYELAPEEKEFNSQANFINVFTYYFKQLFGKDNSTNIFENIDYDNKNSTNRCMEFIYEEIFKFNNSKIIDKDMLFSPDDDTLDINCTSFLELYALYIDNEPIYICKFILPIIGYLCGLDWGNIDWNIVKIKG